MSKLNNFHKNIAKAKGGIAALCFFNGLMFDVWFAIVPGSVNALGKYIRENYCQIAMSIHNA